MQDWLVPLDRIMGSLEETPEGKRFHYPIRHGSMRVGVYAPKAPHDPQIAARPGRALHRDRGPGHVREGRRAARRSAPGDVIFVEAGATHRFEEFGDDFATWVVFWGPKGGEPA